MTGYDMKSFASSGWALTRPACVPDSTTNQTSSWSTSPEWMELVIAVIMCVSIIVPASGRPPIPQKPTLGRKWRLWRETRLQSVNVTHPFAI